MLFLQKLGLHEVKSTLTTIPAAHPNNCETRFMPTVVDSAVVNPIVHNATSSTNVRRSLRSRDNKNYKL